MLEEMRNAIAALDDATMIALMTFSFPFQILANILFHRLTRRNYTFSFSQAYDMFICSLVAVWFWRLDYYKKKETLGFGLIDGEVTALHEQVFQNIVEDLEGGIFHFDYLIAAVSFFFWMRLIMMLKLTKTFGPLISITTAMMVDMLAFFGIYVIQILAFSCIGMLVFSKLPNYRNLFTTFMMLFETSFGSFDFTQYDALEGKKYYGIFFHSLCIIANMLVLLNLVIAIMSDTYSILSE